MGQGATTGAIAGFLVGAIRGRPLEGLATGVIVGGAAGAYDGWKQDAEDERAREIADAIRESGRQPAQPAQPAQNAAPGAPLRRELTRFVGLWQLKGWADDNGRRLEVTGRARGTIEMSYFVELDYLDLKVSGVEERIWGTTTLGYEEGEGFTMTSRFSTLPDAVRMAGRFDTRSGAFRFREYDYRGGGKLEETPAEVRIDFQNQDRFTVETQVDGKTVESYTLSR